MVSERGLGKGLGALLGDAALQSQTSGSVSLPISNVEPSQNQPRKQFEDGALSDLTDSIRLHGIIQPLTVRRLQSGYYQIVAGERRWRAAKAAGLLEVPAIIVEADDKKTMELALIENLQREDLNPLEEAMGYRSLMDEYNLTQQETAQRVGKSRSAVANALRLLALPELVLSLLNQGTLSPGHARAVLSLSNTATQEQLAKRVVAEGLSVRQTEALAKRMGKGPAPSPKPPSQAAEQFALSLAELEKELSGQYGRRVKIAHGKKKGRIELEYYGQEDLDALLQSLSKGGHL